MQSMYSLSEMAAELERQSQAKRDFVADTRRMHFVSELTEGEGGIKTATSTIDLIGEGADSGDSFVLNQIAHQQVATRLGIPTRYYERLRTELPELVDLNVNKLFHHQPERRMLRTLDGTARAFLSDRYRRLDNHEVAKEVLPILGDIPDVRVESCALTDTRMYIKAVTPRVSGEVKVGDEVCAGVVISNSEVGWGAVKVEPLVFRLVCSNGMIAPVKDQAGAMRKYHIGRRVAGDEGSYQVFSDATMAQDDKAFFMALGDVVRAAVSEVRFHELVRDMAQAAASSKVEDPIAAVQVLQKRESLSETEGRDVLKHLAEGGDLTRWGILNAVTRTAQDIEDYDRATELETLGGKILTYTPADWRVLATATA